MSQTLPITAETALSELPAVYERMDQGVEIKDNRQAISNTASDFVAISRSGQKSSADEARNNLQGVFYHGRNFKSKTKILRVAMKGNTALVTSRTHQEFEIVGTTLTEPGVAAKCVQESTSIDTWTRDLGQWQIHRTQEVQSAATIDGQPQ